MLDYNIQQQCTVLYCAELFCIVLHLLYCVALYCNSVLSILQGAVDKNGLSSGVMWIIKEDSIRRYMCVNFSLD